MSRLGTTAVVEEDPATWEDEVRAIEACAPPGPATWGRVVFTGSSSVRMWSTMEADFAPVPVRNHGFGGAQVDAVVHYAPRLVVAYRPCGVVLCAGENDLEGFRGKTAERVLDDVARFAEIVDEAAAPLLLLSLKPSPARAADWPEVERFNAMLEAFATAQGHAFVDVAAAMRDADGRVRRECFLDDGLHLSAGGYAVWTALLRPRLLAAMAWMQDDDAP